MSSFVKRPSFKSSLVSLGSPLGSFRKSLSGISSRNLSDYQIPQQTTKSAPTNDDPIIKDFKEHIERISELSELEKEFNDILKNDPEMIKFKNDVKTIDEIVRKTIDIINTTNNRVTIDYRNRSVEFLNEVLKKDYELKKNEFEFSRGYKKYIIVKNALKKFGVEKNEFENLININFMYGEELEEYEKQQKQQQFGKRSRKKVKKTKKKTNNKIVLVKIVKSNKPEKKLMAVFKNNNTGSEKIVHFGAKGYEDYTMHKDPQRMQRYIKRHSRKENWTKSGLMSPGALSRFVLWSDTDLNRAIKKYKNKFNKKQ